MKIELKSIKIRDLFEQYQDDGDGGVSGFYGRLNIRPAFQREFVYNQVQRDAVIETVRKGFPLNVMYWSKNPAGAEFEFELLDGQQRTISICQYCNSDYSIDYRFMHNLTDQEKNVILDYPLMIYICEGTEKEKLEWFKTINIAGEKLYDQELRNAIYTGPWLTDAKRYFSKPGCAAYQIGKDYLSGSAIRQDYLQTALSWISNKEGKDIEDYMAEHQQDKDAVELWQYYQQVLNWVKVVYPKYDKLQKGIQWGLLYNEFKDEKYNSNELQDEVDKLLIDDEVTNNKGIFEYLIDHQAKHLSLRQFTESMRRVAYKRQDGVCVKCKKHFELKEMQADHIKPWSKGGTTTADNCQMLCRSCNATKSDTY